MAKRPLDDAEESVGEPMVMAVAILEWTPSASKAIMVDLKGGIMEAHDIHGHLKAEEERCTPTASGKVQTYNITVLNLDDEDDPDSNVITAATARGTMTTLRYKRLCIRSGVLDDSE